MTQETPSTPKTEPTDRELELELAVWQERLNSARIAASSLQAQTELLHRQKREIEEGVSRCSEALKARRGAQSVGGPVVNSGGGPGEGQEGP